MNPLWYFGNISRVEAEKVLSACGRNVLLVRESSVPNHYALSRYDAQRRIFGHELIAPVGAGYSIKDSPFDTNIYPSVEELLRRSPECSAFEPLGKYVTSSNSNPPSNSLRNVAAGPPKSQQQALKNYGIADSLNRASANVDSGGANPLNHVWYFGNISRQETEQLLSSTGVDCLLVRNSSVTGNYALSRYDKNNDVFSHQLISPTVGGYKIEDCPYDKKTYTSVEALINQSSECFGFTSLGKLIKNTYYQSKTTQQPIKPESVRTQPFAQGGAISRPNNFPEEKSPAPSNVGFVASGGGLPPALPARSKSPGFDQPEKQYRSIPVAAKRVEKVSPVLPPRSPSYEAPPPRSSPSYEAPPPRVAQSYEAPPLRLAQSYEAPPPRSAQSYEIPTPRSAPILEAPTPRSAPTFEASRSAPIFEAPLPPRSPPSYDLPPAGRQEIRPLSPPPGRRPEPTIRPDVLPPPQEVRSLSPPPQEVRSLSPPPRGRPLSPSPGSNPSSQQSILTLKEKKRREKMERIQKLRDERLRKEQEKMDRREMKYRQSVGIAMKIDGPTDIKHISHVGVSVNGFQIRNIPPDWRALFQGAGVRTSDLKNPETVAFIMDTITDALASTSQQPPPPFPQFEPGLNLPPRPDFSQRPPPPSNFNGARPPPDLNSRQSPRIPPGPPQNFQRNPPSDSYNPRNEGGIRGPPSNVRPPNGRDELERRLGGAQAREYVNPPLPPRDNYVNLPTAAQFRDGPPPRKTPQTFVRPTSVELPPTNYARQYYGQSLEEEQQQEASYEPYALSNSSPEYNRTGSYGEYPDSFSPSEEEDYSRNQYYEDEQYYKNTSFNQQDDNLGLPPPPIPRDLPPAPLPRDLPPPPIPRDLPPREEEEEEEEQQKSAPNPLLQQLVKAQLKAVQSGALPPLETSQTQNLVATLASAMAARRQNIVDDSTPDAEEEESNWDEWT